MAVHAWIADFMISMLHSLTGSLGAGHRHVVPYPARTYLLAIGMALGGVLVGCAGPTASPAATTQSQLSAGSGTPGKLTGAIGNADLAVGQDQRFQLVLIGPDNALVSDASVGVAFFKVNGPSSADLKFQAPTEYEETPGLPGHGLYVARATFDEPGQWGVVADVQEPGADPTQLRLAFTVKDHSYTPQVGQPVPASQTPTGTTPEEIAKFSSAQPADPAFYRLSIASALAQHKPLVVLFASPGFCTSRTCGPSMDVLADLHQQFGDDVNFIHVEIYKDAHPPDTASAVTEWGLPSEPWMFVVGPDGRLVQKFEGVIRTEDVAPVVGSLLGAA